MADTDDELHQGGEERIELAARDQQELDELRQRREVLAAAETNEAIRLAEASRELRRDANAKHLQARSDQAHGGHLLDEAAVGRDEPGAAAMAAAGRRYQRASVREDQSARSDDAVADQYDEEARERRGEVRREQRPASEAARPPAEPPRARRFVSKKVKKLHDRSTEPDLGMGD